MNSIMGGFLSRILEPHKPCAKIRSCACATKEQTAPSPVSDSIYDGRRIDYDRIIDLIEPGSSVLDVGCGDGVLLCRLVHEKQARGTGMELSQDNVISCVECGLSVIQADIDEGLSGIPSQSYDYVILSMTLQVIQRPEIAIGEMLRVGRRCIISFPNFAFWKVRAKLLLSGRAPVTRNLPYTWHTSPNRHVLSIRDFRKFCEHNGAKILREIPLSSHGRRVHISRIWPNMLADEAVFVISR
jgi:methionine biosynthesis protein MetW